MAAEVLVFDSDFDDTGQSGSVTSMRSFLGTFVTLVLPWIFFTLGHGQNSSPIMISFDVSFQLLNTAIDTNMEYN